MKKRKKIWFLIFLFLFLLFIVYFLYQWNYIPHKKYTNEDFHIETYYSSIDKDQDGIDDQTDILNSVREYIEKKPKYKSVYYKNGYPDDGYGVCTDVVAFGLLKAGYDLRELVNEDIRLYNQFYNIDVIDNNIDFRIVRNLKIYFYINQIYLKNNIKYIKKQKVG